MCQPQPRCPAASVTASERAGPPEEKAWRSGERSAHLYGLLSEREPAFLATLRAAERQVDAELARGTEGNGGLARTRIGRPMMNRVTLYHGDRTMCADSRTCLRDDHTTVPPRCGVVTDLHAPGCELPVGHPGPHLPTGYATDRRHGPCLS